MKFYKFIIAKSREILHSLEIKKRTVKDHEHHFTRNRKLTYEVIVLMILSHFQTTIKTALDHFPLLERAKIKVCQSAFSQARARINHIALLELFGLTAHAGYSDRKSFNKAGKKLFFGRLISAIDGSQISLPHTAELKKFFGTSGSGDKAVTARCSVLYDVLNDIILDAKLDPFSCGEREQALDMLKEKHVFTGVKELVIFDRGYYSRDFMSKLLSLGYEFVFRIPRKKLVQADDLPLGIHTVNFELNSEKSVKIKVVKFALPSGEIETLVTNFYLRKMTVEDYKKLYFMRWPVETKFDIVKNKIQLENFTGRTVNAILQDFYACMYLTNVAAIFKSEADVEIREQRKDKNNKYEYQANVNEIVGTLKDCLILAVAEEDPANQNQMLDMIFDEIKRAVVPIRPNRSVPRNDSVRKLKFFHNMKNNL